MITKTEKSPSEPDFTHFKRIAKKESRVNFTFDFESKMAPPLRDFFEQVWVINLRRRAERLARFWTEIQKSNWPFRRPKVFSAIEGDKVGVPKFWQTGGGSYGCLRSHLTILERAIQDDIKSILILEDDAIFQKNFAQNAGNFLIKVPDDWQCLMMGGQHINSKPFPVAPGVVRAGAGGGIQRTHCYALRGTEIMRALYETWANAAVHCDWVMGPCTAKFNTYAPDPFLVGQADGESDISGATNPPKFWRSATGLEPVIVLHAPRSVMDCLRKKGWHAGFVRDQKTGIDEGLFEIFDDTNLTPADRVSRLKHWIEMIQGEIASMVKPAICTVWHPEIKADMVRPLTRGRVIEITATTPEEALNQLPADIQVQEPVTQSMGKMPIVLLRSSRAVLEVLREEGWHTGYWRDEITGLDNGLRRLFASASDETNLRKGLFDIIHILQEELKQKGSGVVTLWHDAITLEMVKADGLQIFEINATSANDAKIKLAELQKPHAT